MKYIFFKVLSCIISFYCGVIRYYPFDKVRYIKARIYTMYLSKYLNKISEKSYVFPPLNHHGLGNVTIGSHSLIGKCSIINAVTKYLNDNYNPLIKIGNNVEIGEYAHISSINSIIINDYVLTGRWLTIVDNSHGKFILEDLEICPTHRRLYTKGGVVIEDHVWIGDKVSIMAGVRIGRCSIIGSNSVVTHDIPAFSMAAGVPAKIIRSLK